MSLFETEVKFILTKVKDKKKGSDKENFCFIRENQVINQQCSGVTLVGEE